MSNIQRAENLRQLVQKTAPDFNKLAQIHGAVHFEREASFAMQILEQSDYLAGIAMSKPDSLRRAVLNVAAVGLSLSPVHKLAYLVPRKKEVCLDISYRGYVHLAIEAGVIEWAKAEIVYEKDTYIFTGMNEMPDHKFEPFKDRGAVIGAYCVAKLPSGEYMVENMSLAEAHAIRDRSESWKSGGMSPWKTDENEMIKKTVIRRAWKSWPNTTSSERFAAAAEVAEETDPMVFDTTAVPIEDDESTRLASYLNTIRVGLAYIGKDEANYLAYVARIVKRDLKDLSELTLIEAEQQSAYINQLVDKKKEVDNAAS